MLFSFARTVNIRLWGAYFALFSNYTCKFQTKDQIGTFTYFPTVGMQPAAGGFGALNVYQRPQIPTPYPNPDSDLTLLIGDRCKAIHKVSYSPSESFSSKRLEDGCL